MGRSAAAVLMVALLAGCNSGDGIGPVQQGASLSRPALQGTSRAGPDFKHCAPWPSGSGILADGDFHGALLPKGKGWTYFSAGDIFARGWRVKKGSIAVVSPAIFPAPNGVCSIDLDGQNVRGIEHKPFASVPSTSYSVSFLFSGNGPCGPPVKTLMVRAAGQSTTLSWNLASEGNAKSGNFLPETWTFNATETLARLEFISLDPPDAGCGPVVAAISVTQASR